MNNKQAEETLKEIYNYYKGHWFLTRNEKHIFNLVKSALED